MISSSSENIGLLSRFARARKVDSAYNPSGEGGIFWADLDWVISWPVSHPIVWARDEKLPSFAAYRANPINWNEYTNKPR